MIKKLNKLVLHSLQELYFSVVPAVVSFEILEFYFFRTFFSKTYCRCLPVVLSKKEKDYINFRVLHTRVKLFNSFICKTIYSLLLKELKYYILYIITFKEKTLIIWRNTNILISSR